MITLPPTLDIETVFPFLAGRSRTTWRLHPRRASALDLMASKLGGNMPWPAEEEFPLCPDRGILAIPVIQLRRDSGVPLPFPDGTDLFQLLWYPAEYEDNHYLPRLLVRYRTIAALGGCAVLTSVLAEPDMGYTVHECALSVESVVEYPYIHSLNPNERARVRAWEDDRGEPTYQYLLSTCPGTKVGGYPDYAGQDDFSPPLPWEYLLTLSDAEWDGGSAPRWKPAESTWPDGAAIGTYLKAGLNLFLDRTQTPWRVQGAR